MIGADIRTAQELMVHETIQVTLRYAHPAAQHQLESVQRLCDTGLALEGSTDTGTGTRGSEQFSTVPLAPTKLNFLNSLERQGRDGGTGRRSGLKIRRKQFHGGSIPPPGTIYPIYFQWFRAMLGSPSRSIGVQIRVQCASYAFSTTCTSLGPRRRQQTIYS